MPRRSIWSARQSAARFDRCSEGQHYRMAGLSLLAPIVIYWYTAHIGEAVRQRKLAGQAVNPELLPTSCSLANIGGQSVDSCLSVRFCPSPESTPLCVVPDPGPMGIHDVAPDAFRQGSPYLAAQLGHAWDWRPVFPGRVRQALATIHGGALLPEYRVEAVQ